MTTQSDITVVFREPLDVDKIVRIESELNKYRGVDAIRTIGVIASPGESDCRFVYIVDDQQEVDLLARAIVAGTLFDVGDTVMTAEIR